MSFKLILLLIFMSLFGGCGVKGDPLIPKEPKMPSLMENYPDIKPDRPLDENKRVR